MIQVVIGYLGAVVVIAAFLWYVSFGSSDSGSLWVRLSEHRDKGAAKKRVPADQLVSKEIIQAMAQQRVYRMDGEVSLDEYQLQWCHETVVEFRKHLDASLPTAEALQRVLDEFCDRVEKVVEVYKENLCELNIKIKQIGKERLEIEKQIYQPVETSKSVQKHKRSDDKQPYEIKLKKCKTTSVLTEDKYLTSVLHLTVKEMQCESRRHE